MSETDDTGDAFVLDHALLLGVWANQTKVRLGRDEITIDFVRDATECREASSSPEYWRRHVLSSIFATTSMEFCGATLIARCRRISHD